MPACNLDITALLRRERAHALSVIRSTRFDARHRRMTANELREIDHLFRCVGVLNHEIYEADMALLRRAASRRDR